MKVEITTMTPAKARTLLDANTANRRLSKRRVEAIARDMQQGRWQDNGATIRVDASGVLLDGQHRLSACVRADFAFSCVLVTDLAPEVMQTIDSGRARSFRHVLQIEGCANASRHATITRMHATITAGPSRYLATSQYTVGELAKWRLDHLEHIGAASDLYVRVGKITQHRSILLAWYAFMHQHIGAESIEPFWNRLLTGAPIYGDDDPVFVVRDYMVRNLGDRLGTRESFVRALLVLKAWNRVQQGESMRQPKMMESEIPRFKIVGLPIGMEWARKRKPRS